MNFADLRDRIPEFSKEHARALALLSGVGVAIAVLLFTLTRGNDELISAPLPIPSISQVETFVFVDVTGKVVNPGVYQLKQGARANDAITAAGGAKGGVDLSDINLARVIVDGEQIYVGALSSSSGTRNGKLNINRATKAQFDGLPGIGPVLASRIIAYRNKNGQFITVADLQKVSGIGGAKFDDIKDLLRI